MWWDIMVSALILLVFRWYIFERKETWTRSKENCSSDATSVYVCEWNKEFWENTMSREFIIEWVINRATASLSVLNTSGSVAMDRYQWLSNTNGWHYMLIFTASHTQNAEINRDNRNDKTTCSTASDPCWVNMQINGSCWEWMAIGIIVALYCKYEDADDDDDGCWLGNIFCLPLNVKPNSLILTLQKWRACYIKYIR